MTKATATNARKPRLRTIVLVLGVAAVSIASLAALAVWQMSLHSPDWWRSLDPTSDETIAVGTAVEHTIANEFHRVERPGQRIDDGDPSTPPSDDPWISEPWAISITASEANAWLNTRLRPWLESQDDEFAWPSDLAEIQVNFDHQTIQLGIRLKRTGRDRLLSATVEPLVSTDGELWMPASWAYVGRLPIPARWVLDQSDRRLEKLVADRVQEDETAQVIVGALKGLEPASDDPIIRLGDGRQVRLLGLRSYRGRLDLVCQTEFRP